MVAYVCAFFVPIATVGSLHAPLHLNHIPTFKRFVANEQLP